MKNLFHFNRFFNAFIKSSPFYLQKKTTLGISKFIVIPLIERLIS
jgi:hypothetical protein